MPDVQQKPLPPLPERRAWQGNGSVGALPYSRGIFRMEEEDAAYRGLMGWCHVLGIGLNCHKIWLKLVKIKDHFHFCFFHGT